MQLNSSLSHTAASARTTDSVLYNSDQAALLREKLIQLREQQQAEKDASEEQPYHHSSATTASPADSQAERLKAIAADKIQRLKAMVTMMQQMATFATGEEAQAILRRLKMIVGELKQAVAMHAQAGGSGGGSANTAMPSAAPATDTGKGAPAPAPATPSAPAPTAAPAQPQAATPTTETPAATKERDSKAASSVQAGMQTEQSSQNGQGSQDDEFLNEVEKLKRLIQQVARAAEQALRRDQSPNADLQQIYRDLKHIDKLSQEIASGQSPQGLAQSVQTIQAAYSASTTTGIVGNVQVNLAPPVVNTHT